MYPLFMLKEQDRLNLENKLFQNICWDNLQLLESEAEFVQKILFAYPHIAANKYFSPHDIGSPLSPMNDRYGNMYHIWV